VEKKQQTTKLLLGLHFLLVINFLLIEENRGDKTTNKQKAAAADGGVQCGCYGWTEKKKKQGNVVRGCLYIIILVELLQLS